MLIVSRSHGEHQFIHLEPIAGNPAFPGGPQSSWRSAKAGGRKGLTPLPMGLPGSLSLPSPTLSAGGAGDEAGVSSGERVGSCLALCSKSSERAGLATWLTGGALGHGEPAERKCWGSFRLLRVSTLGGRGRGWGCSGLAGLSSLILNAHRLPAPTGYFLYSSRL